jgi:hypothetical protein
MRPILLFAFLLTVSAPSVFAKGPKEGKTKTLTDEETFKALDKDGDNLLSKEEFCAPPPASADAKPRQKRGLKARSAEEFETLDADKDGKLTLEEFGKRTEAPAEGPQKKRRKPKAEGVPPT